MKETVAIIQARLRSTRLPGKVLKDIAGKPMLEWVVERTRRSKLVQNVVVATTIDSSDDDIFAFCKKKSYHVKRGSIYDVLDRYYQTARQFQAEIIVRITADCPFIDPALIDEVVSLLRGGQMTGCHQESTSIETYDFVANRLPIPWGRTYPIGLDVESFTFDILQEAWKNAVEKHQREHVAPYFYEDAAVEDLKSHDSNLPYTQTKTPKGFHIALMHHFPDYGQLRWTVDTPEDLELVRLIAAQCKGMDFGWRDVLEFTQCNPSLIQINANIPHKTHLDVDQQST